MGGMRRLVCRSCSQGKDTGKLRLPISPADPFRMTDRVRGETDVCVFNPFGIALPRWGYCSGEKTAGEPAFGGTTCPTMGLIASRNCSETPPWKSCPFEVGSVFGDTIRRWRPPAAGSTAGYSLAGFRPALRHNVCRHLGGRPGRTVASGADRRATVGPGSVGSARPTRA
jgi:hypothetical protein